MSGEFPRVEQPKVMSLQKAAEFLGAMVIGTTGGVLGIWALGSCLQVDFPDLVDQAFVVGAGLITATEATAGR